MGISMVIAAWGEGVMWAFPPLPRRIARRQPKARVKTLAEAWIPKENMFYAVGACVMDVSMVIEAWREGVGCHVPLPLVRSLVVHLNVRKNAGWVHRMRPHLPRASPPLPAPNQEKRTEKFGVPLVFPTHVCDSTHPLAYIIG